MAGNFWQSSHSSQWILDKVDLVRERQNDLQALASQGDPSAGGGTGGVQGALPFHMLGGVVDVFDFKRVDAIFYFMILIMVIVIYKSHHN